MEKRSWINGIFLECLKYWVLTVLNEVLESIKWKKMEDKTGRFRKMQSYCLTEYEKKYNICKKD
jgi:hypothetical protein